MSVTNVSVATDFTDILVTTFSFVLDSPVWKFQRRGKSFATDESRTPDSLAHIVVAVKLFNLSLSQ